MNPWSEHVVPRVADRSLSSGPVMKLRAEAVTGLDATVLEIGFGSGLNSLLYPDAVERVIAIEPSLVARKLATDRVAESRTAITFEGLDGQELPLPDESVDHALSTFTLCTIPDADAALREIRRVLKPGGTLHFLEHGASPDAGVAKWQRRLNGMQRLLAAGCNLDRSIDELVAGAGLDVVELRNVQLPGPAVSHPWTYLYLGRAVKATRFSSHEQ